MFGSSSLTPSCVALLRMIARSLARAGVGAGHLLLLEKALLMTSLAEGHAATNHQPISHSTAAVNPQLTQGHMLQASPTAGSPMSPGPPSHRQRSFHSSACHKSWDAANPLASVFASNQFASGGLVLMAVGATAAVVKSLVDHLSEYAQRRLFVRADVDSRDEAYRWIMHWISQHSSFSNSPRVSVLTSLAAFGTKSLEGGLLQGKQVLFVPAPGDHLLVYKGRYIWITRTRAAAALQAMSGRTQLETMTLTTWGRSRQLLEELIADAAAAYEETTRQRTVVHSVQDGFWERVGSRPIRPVTSVILPRNKAAEILADCREFLDSEAWYAHHGIPHRRGYLLYGTPGTGKTSLVTALAGELGLDVYVITLSSPSMTDEMLRGLLNSAAPRSLLLLEDVDVAFVKRDSAASSSSLSFSGLLNAIDGVAAQEGRLLFMTTNHIDRLSNALIRPGRVDFRLEFKMADSDQIRTLFHSFYKDVSHFHSATSAPIDTTTAATASALQVPSSPAQGGPAVPPSPASPHRGQVAGGASLGGPSHAAAAGILAAARLERLAEKFASAVPEYTVSMAALQGYLMQYKTDPEAAVQDAAAWVAALPSTAAS